MTDLQACPKCGHQGSGRFCARCGVELALALDAVGVAVDIVQPPVRPRPVGQPGRAVPATSVKPGGVMGSTQGVAFTDKVHEVLGRTSEELVWQGSPSLTLLVGLVLRYLVVIAVVFFLPFEPEALATVVGILAVLGVLQLLLRFAKLRTTKYRISTERIEVATGMLSRSTRTYETHQAKDISIHRPFPISFLGAAHLNVIGKGWAIRVLGVPAEHAEAIRDAVRESGRREAARAELIEWR